MSTPQQVTDPKGQVHTIVHIDWQVKSVFLSTGERLGFAAARKALGVDL